MQNTTPPPADTPPPKKRATGLYIIAAAILAPLAGLAISNNFGPPKNPVSAENAIPWESDFDTALTEAAAQDKEVLVRFSATWCPPCRVMKKNVWPDAEIADAVTKSYIPLDLDVDDATASQLASRYGVNAVPTILRLDSHGEVTARANFMRPKQTLKFLASAPTR